MRYSVAGDRPDILTDALLCTLVDEKRCTITSSTLVGDTFFGNAAQCTIAFSPLLTTTLAMIVVLGEEVWTVPVRWDIAGAGRRVGNVVGAVGV